MTDATAPQQLYGTTFDCACGKTHSIEPRAVLYTENAAEALPALIHQQLPKASTVCVVADTRTAKAAGNAVADALTSAAFSTTICIVADPEPNHSPVCDTQTKDALKADLPTVDLLIAVGAGVISDLTKWCAYETDRPYIAVGTAASMNGYASANVAPSVDGVKTLARARPPIAVVGDPAVLADAPQHLTASGLGDILAKSCSSTDWKLNAMLFGDYYCDRSVKLIEEIEPLYLDNPTGILNGQGEAIHALFDGLLLTGVAMTMAETSSPASGGEHMISHTLDMMSSVDGQPHDLHGRQVGVGTILMSEVYRRVLAIESPEPRLPNLDIDTPFWGHLAPHVEKYYQEKAPRMREAVEKIPAIWDELRSALSPMLRTPERVRDCLKTAQAAYRAEDLGMSRQRLLKSLLHAHEIRSRVTILDLARILGVLPNCAQELIDEWT